MVSKYIVRVNNGITEVSRPTSSTVIVRIPYSMLNKELHTKNSFIVYILFGHSTKGKDKIYVGKSKNGIDYRPTSHEDKYDSWEYCYVLTQHKENTFFNDGIIQYIENQISNHVNDIGRFENTTVTTTDSTVNEYEKDDCEAYIDDAYNMLYAIGLDLITPVNEEDNIVVETTKEPEVAPVVNYNDPNVFKFEGNKRDGSHFKAFMVIKENKYIVLKGSIIPNTYLPSATDSKTRIEKQRAKCKFIDNILQHNVEFNSPSGACAFVYGGLGNGWRDWKNYKGISLEDVVGR